MGSDGSSQQEPGPPTSMWEDFLMPIILHQLLMIVTMFVTFFVCGFVGWDRRDALMAAGVPEWLLWVSPLLAVFGSALLFALIPARCPGCGWPVAFLRLSEQLMYRCARCRHIHLTMWRNRTQATGPEYNRVWLPPMRATQPHQQRITFSGDTNRPCTLLLVMSPAPAFRAKLELTMSVDACLTNEQGEVLLRVEGPLKEWDSEPWFHFWRPTIAFRHPEWRDVALRGVDRFALEIHVHNTECDGRSRTLRLALEFLHFGAASRSIGPHGTSNARLPWH